MEIAMDREVRGRALEVQDNIRGVLFDEWDPIGVNDYAPRDEYDAYIGGIYRLLGDGTDAEALVRHLRSLEIEQMGIARHDQVGVGR